MISDRVMRLFTCGPALALGTVLSASQSTQLNGDLPGPGSLVTASVVDPSGALVLYVADQDQAGVFELYRVPFDQSAPPQRLSAAMPAFGDVSAGWQGAAVLVGPAGRAVYRADASVDGSFELFSVPLDGSQAPVALCPPMTAGGEITWYAFSPDGAYVAYRADQDLDDVVELFAVPADGSAPAHKVHAPLAVESIAPALIDPTSPVIVYAVNEYVGMTLVSELFRAPLDGSSAPVLLGSFSAPEPSTGIHSVAFSPDGTWLTFALSRVNSYFEDSPELFLVPADGSQAAHSLGSSGGARFTADGSRVVFGRGSHSGPPQYMLFSATLTGSPVALDNPSLAYLGGLCLDSSGTTAIFAEGSGIYRVPVDGSSAPTPLTTAFDALTRFEAMELSADEEWVVFATNSFAPAPKLWSMPATGGPPQLLAEPPPGSWARIGRVRIAPDSRHVVYEAWTGPSASQFELFLTRMDGARPPHRLNDPLVAGGTVSGSTLVGEDWVLYSASQGVSGVYGLFKSPLAWPRWRSAARPPGPPILH